MSQSKAKTKALISVLNEHSTGMTYDELTEEAGLHKVDAYAEFRSLRQKKVILGRHEKRDEDRSVRFYLYLAENFPAPQ
ncbi:hypothetical protein GCM10009565_48800 [Amycolatopsis albidoflavus]